MADKNNVRKDWVRGQWREREREKKKSITKRTGWKCRASGRGVLKNNKKTTTHY